MITNKELYKITITYSMVGREARDKIVSWYNKQNKHINLKVERL